MDAQSVGDMVMAMGETVTVARGAASAQVKAKIRDGAPEDVPADRHVASHRLVMAAADPGWSGFPVPPAPGDTVAFAGRTHLVTGVRVPKLGEAATLYVATITGPV